MLLCEANPLNDAHVVPTMDNTSTEDIDVLVHEIEGALARTVSDDADLDKCRSPLSLSFLSFNLDVDVTANNGARPSPLSLSMMMRHHDQSTIADVDDFRNIMSHLRNDGSDAAIERDSTAVRTARRESLSSAAFAPTPQDITTVKNKPDTICTRTSSRARKPPAHDTSRQHTARISKLKKGEARSAGKPKAKKSGRPRSGITESVAGSIPLPLPKDGPLPVDHRPARGRGRASQLRTMTKVQIEAERRAMQEKNRLAARELRLKRKEYEASLEARVSELEKKDMESLKMIEKLKARLLKYEQC